MHRLSIGVSARIAVAGFACAASNLLAQDCGSWAQVATSGPAGRGNAMMTYDSGRGRVVLLGGSNASGHFGDTWEWDGASWTMRSNSGPVAREGAGLCYDSDRAKTVLFGGQPINFSYLNDTWEWNGSSWTQVFTTTLPPGRWEHAMDYDTVHHKTIVFGGYNGAYLNDTWSYDGSNWSLIPVSGPSPRNAHSMVFDSRRGRMVLFGGYGGGPMDLGDTWEWDGTAWTMRSSTGPVGRDNLAMVYDSARGRTVLFGGSSAGVLSDTWEWTGSLWRYLSSVGPSARFYHAMAYDSGRDRAVVFGGRDGQSQLGDTWELTGDPSITQQPAPVAVCLGDPVNLSVQAAGSPPITYQWRHNGVNIPGLPAAAHASDAGLYDVVVGSFCNEVTSHTAMVTVRACQATIYVNAAAPAGGTGVSWSSPLTDLQDALDLARVSPSVTQIWVARGHYKADRGTRDRTMSFTLVANVALYGGFAGNEASLAARDLSAGLSTLDGDLLGDDVQDPEVNRLDNTNNIVVVGTASNTRLDGFEVRGGWSSTPSIGAGLLGQGGVAYTVANCIFSRDDGQRGAAIWSNGAPTIISTIFRDNRCILSGGAVHLQGVNPSGPLIANCLFNGNYSDVDGGGLYAAGNSIQIVNCTFVGNWARTGTGGAVWVIPSSIAPSITGSIVWGNGTSSGGPSAQLAGPLQGMVNYSCVQDWDGSLGGTGNTGLNPLLVDQSGPPSYLTFGTIMGNPRIRANSPCIDAGDSPSAHSAGLTLDLDSHPRFLNDSGTPDVGRGPAPVVDMGSYEFQLTSCYANCDGSTASPVLNVNDFICFQGRFAAGDVWANCDQSTAPPVLNVNDFICFQQRFAAGCH